jgi:hypothetical protein
MKSGKFKFKQIKLRERFMARQTLKHFALSLVAFGLALSASLSMAQGGQAGTGRLGRRHPSKTVRHAKHAPALGSSTYTFTYFGFPQAEFTQAYSLNLGIKNSKIEVVGPYTNQTGTTFGSGFLLKETENKSKGTFTEEFSTVNIPGFSLQQTDGINDSGDIVGEYIDDSSSVQGYLLSGGTFTEIQVPFAGATSTLPDDINDSGEIVGIWEAGSNPIQSFVLSGAVYTALSGYPGATETQAIANNNKGDIAGYYADSSGVYHGFLLIGGTYTSIDVPGAVGTFAFGINDSDDIVGYYCTTSECLTDYTGESGFLLSGDVFTTINVPTADSTELGNINNKGVIVGWYYDSGGANLSFIATP